MMLALIKMDFTTKIEYKQWLVNPSFEPLNQMNRPLKTHQTSQWYQGYFRYFITII